MLPRTEFYKDTARKEGITAYCKICKTAINQNWRDVNPKKYKQSQLRQRRKREYNLSDENFANMLEKQQHQCAICHVEIDWSCHVDHNHTTGVVRGLLCGTCNTGLGMFKDNIEILREAIKYLEANLPNNRYIT